MRNSLEIPKLREAVETVSHLRDAVRRLRLRLPEDERYVGDEALIVLNKLLKLLRREDRISIAAYAYASLRAIWELIRYHNVKGKTARLLAKDALWVWKWVWEGMYDASRRVLASFERDVMWALRDAGKYYARALSIWLSNPHISPRDAMREVCRAKAWELKALLHHYEREEEEAYV